MDWINEKIEMIRERVQNMSLKTSLMMYLLFGMGVCFLCSWVTETICFRWINILQESESTRHTAVYFAVLNGVYRYSPYVYMAVTGLIMGICFYRKRLQTPFKILEKGAEEISNNRLDFTISYNSEDEMGQLCKSFEKMRQELVQNKEKMWELIEEQKKINSAFAHDLRTPLTVVKGYSDFLARYIPEGKVSEEKLVGTLRLMSEHIQRLEKYSRTMREIRNFDEWDINKEETDILRLQGKIEEMAEALSAIGDIRIAVQSKEDKSKLLWLDENVILEVLENLLSNAIRYAKENIWIILETDMDKEMLYLYVRDDGVGFSEEELKKAKNPYFYGKSCDEEHFGIGLYIVSSLAEKCGGTLNVANGIEGGAFVSVSFSFKKS